MIIDAVYDFLCPWCLVGKRHLEIAMTRVPQSRPVVNWHQFMLYPHFDRAGHDFLAFFRERYGDDLRVPMWDRIRAAAAPVGIHFAFEKITRGPASIDGHRLVRWAERNRSGSSAAMIETIATAFFERAETIDFAFLARTAGEHGFDADAALAFLESDADLSQPFAETDAWLQRGVRSMPHYILTFADGSVETVTQTSIEIFADALRRDLALVPPARPAIG